MTKKVIIIGAGFGGLSSAALLRKEGYEVTVVEARSSPGGRARLWEEGGYAFDMGPSWYLMGPVFDRYFSLFNKNREDYWKLQKLRTHYKVFFGDTEQVEITEDFERTQEIFEGFEKGGAQRLKNYVDLSQYKYDTAIKDFLYRDYRHVFQFLNRRLMTEGLRLNVFNSLDSYVGKFFTDHRAKKILEYAMVFLGSSPTNAPALYSLMSYLDLKDGIHFPVGGMYAIVEGLVRLNQELGVQIIYDTDVTSIDVVAGRVRGVSARQGTATISLQGDAVLMSGDYVHGERDLLAPEYRSYSPAYWDRGVLAPSMFNAYLGIHGAVDGLAHTLRQTAVFRPAMRSKRVKGLFYAGQYTHPGIGVPMTFIASEVVTPVVDAYLSGKQ